MKTIKLFAILTLCISRYTTFALCINSNTFAPTCQPVFSITTLTNSVDCYSLSANLINAGDPDSYYSWDFGDEKLNETGKTVYHCYESEVVAGNTTRTVTLTYTNPALNCVGVSTATLNVQVIAPIPCANVPSEITLSALTVTVWAGSFIPEVMTSYNFGDGSPTNNSSVHTYTACGNYIIHTRIWDMNTPSSVCHSYSAANINCSLSTGINERDMERISVFPNPASTFISIKSDKTIKKITITDLLGRSTLQNDFDKNNPTVSISHLPAGTYFLTVWLDSGIQKSLRFIKD